MQELIDFNIVFDLAVNIGVDRLHVAVDGT